MPHDSRLLKGKLTFGDASAGNAAEGQITNLTIEQESGSSSDVTYVLSGESIGGESSAGVWKLKGTLIQDFAAGAGVSLQQWSYHHRDTVQQFTFTPNDDAAAPTVTGHVHVAFLGLGGEVKNRITREFDWTIQGEPDFGDWGKADTAVRHEQQPNPAPDNSKKNQAPSNHDTQPKTDQKTNQPGHQDQHPKPDQKSNDKPKEDDSKPRTP